VTHERSEGDRNALLAVHFGEGDARTLAATRAHVEGCPRCQEYLRVLSDVDAALREWPEEVPPPGLAGRVLSRVTRAPQPQPVAAAASAMPLVALLPVIATLLVSIRQLAQWLEALPYWVALEKWVVLERWPAVQGAAPFGAAVAVLFALGGLASLAAAPALVMENRR
jgi:anti-sigma factor RsiW